jgi:methylmalonyl-CoA mutase
MPTASGADAFPPVSHDEWAAAVVAELGPDALARRLRFRWEDGIALDALWTDPGPGAGVAAAVGRLVAEARHPAVVPQVFAVRERFDGSTARLEELRDALQGGADSIELDLSRVDPAAVGARLNVLRSSLAGAGHELALASLPVARYDAILPVLLQQDVPLAAGVDPYAAWVNAGAGGDPGPAVTALARLGPLVELGRRHRLLRASAAAWYDAGATVGWSMALTVAAGLEYVRALSTGGVPPAAAARQVELELALGPDIFENLAAVRAARLVWSRGLEVLGIDPLVPPRLVVTAGRRVLSARDPWTNALRETAVAFAAAAGGADVVRLPAMDVRTGASLAARRLARNTPLILREEAGLARVADPAGGAWYFDAATGLLAERVWAMLGELDGAGGLAAALASGLVEQRIEAQRTARQDAVRRRLRPITGVSEYPERAEQRHDAARLPVTAPSRFRLRADAEPFERLQDAADSWAQANRGRRSVVLVRLGPGEEPATRVAFARGLVEAGGLEVVVTPEAATPAEAVEVATACRACAAILCGADARYVAEAAPFASALRQSGVMPVLVAGRPGTDADALRAAGVDDFAFAGADVVAVLERLLRAAGVLP